MNWLAYQTNHGGVKDWYMNPDPHVENAQRDIKLCRHSAAILGAPPRSRHNSASLAYQFIDYYFFNFVILYSAVLGHDNLSTHSLS